MFFTTFYIPVYFQFTRNDDSLMAAVRLLPYLVLLIAVNLATGWVLPKVNYYMPVSLISGMVITLASVLFYVYLWPSTPTGHVYGFSILMGIGSGMTMQLGYAVSSLKVSRPADVFGASRSFQRVPPVKIILRRRQRRKSTSLQVPRASKTVSDMPCFFSSLPFTAPSFLRPCHLTVPFLPHSLLPRKPWTYSTNCNGRTS